MAEKHFDDKSQYANGDYEEPRKASFVNEKGARIGEASDLYGDIAQAEEYGYVTRG